MQLKSKILFLALVVHFYTFSMNKQAILQQNEINNNSEELNQEVTEFLYKSMYEYLPKNLINIIIDYADRKSECYLKYIRLQIINTTHSTKFFVELKNGFLIFQDIYGDIIIYKPNENGLYTKLQEITDWNVKYSFSKPEVKQMIELQNGCLMFLDGGVVNIYTFENGKYHVWQTLSTTSSIEYMTELKNRFLAFYTGNGEIEIWKRTLLIKNAKITECQATPEKCIIS